MLSDTDRNDMRAFLNSQYSDLLDRAAAEVILWGMSGVTNADKISKVSGLSRDKIVRPIVKKLKKNELWDQKGPILDAPIETGFVLAVLCAKGVLVGRRKEVEEDLPKLILVKTGTE